MINKYKTIVFDCDGVILNSNKIKTQAFYDVAKVYGQDAANMLVDYHVKNGGISRYKKFEYLLTHIVNKSLEQAELNILLNNFASEVKKALMKCDMAKGLRELRINTEPANWLIVSGGDQNELREVFAARGIVKYFDGGIFGSPDTKEIIINRELQSNNIEHPALFIGDSKYDYTAAQQGGLDFVFVSDWTEVCDWQGWAKNKKIMTISDLTKIYSMARL